MSQNESNNKQSESGLQGPQSEASSRGATSNHSSPLTTPVNYYGTMEFSEKPAENETSQQNASTDKAANVEVPKPAVRRKIQQTALSGHPQAPEGSIEKISQLNETIEAIDQQRSALVKMVPAVGRANESGEKQAGTDLNSFALAIKQEQKQSEQDIQQQQQQQQLIEGPSRPYPKKVLFIIANEFCERFSYYGLRTVLVLYFKSVLGLTNSGSTISFHLFATLCYLTPILGAILGDSILGKYKTILYLSIVYFLGEFILVVSSVFWNLNTWSMVMTWAGLLLIGIGTGGIKPCVAAFAGDQFLPNESKWRENFFSLFYGAINLGSLISMFLTPLLRSNYHCVGRNDCYPYAFGLPCLLIFIATLVFLMANNYYYVAPLPKENVIAAFVRCTWVALKRKISGHKPYRAKRRSELVGQINHSLSESHADDSSLANSRTSMTSSENEAKPVVSSLQLSAAHEQEPSEGFVQTNIKRDHWLYLAADQYDKDSIEEFRSVLGILLLFLPTPVYWCLFDQQGSLWTLQATRMDGRVFGTTHELEPDQMMVANPLLLLTAIPIFQCVIYPALERCNLITSSIQRMTTGGLMAALSFVASALIEFQMQANQPHLMPMSGHANVLLVNGLSDCALANATIHFNQQQAVNSHSLATPLNQTSFESINMDFSLALRSIDSLEPLSSQTLRALPISNSSSVNYRLNFRLANRMSPLQAESTANQSSAVGCPFDPSQENEINIGALPNQAVRLLYVDHGNGKLSHKLFNDSLGLPEANQARVRLLYEFFGSYSVAQKRTFYLTLAKESASNQNSTPSKQFNFTMSTRDGQVMLSDYVDIGVTPSSENFFLYSSDPVLSLQQAQPVSIRLKPGTRNLLILHQLDASSVQLKQELLQDNDYRISMLYQLIPYTLISISEVMFSITGLEFSYAMAPPNLKSVILGAWSLTTAFGNILTVAVESWHPFSNIGHDFLFYAALMAADMVLFAYLGYRYQPYQPYVSKSQSTRSKTG